MPSKSCRIAIPVHTENNWLQGKVRSGLTDLRVFSPNLLNKTCDLKNLKFYPKSSMIWKGRNSVFRNPVIWKGYNSVFWNPMIYKATILSHISYDLKRLQFYLQKSWDLKRLIQLVAGEGWRFLIRKFSWKLPVCEKTDVQQYPRARCTQFCFRCMIMWKIYHRVWYEIYQMEI